jgi:hypothetical protein
MVPEVVEMVQEYPHSQRASTGAAEKTIIPSSMGNAYMIRSKVLGAVAREDAERTTNNIVNIHLDQMAGPEVDLGVLREIRFVCATSEDERHGLSDLMKRGIL